MSRPQRRKTLLNDAAPPLSPLPPAAKAPEGAWKFAVPLLVVLYVLFAGLHAFWVPTGQAGYQNAPDEAAHVHYVRSLTSGHLPTQADAGRDPTARSYEWHQPPLYYAWTALFSGLGPRGMRVASILLGVMSLLLIYAASRLLFPDDPILTAVATGIAALLPTHIAITSTVNNDVLLECCFSATLLLLVQCLLRGLSLWRAGWIGFVLGIALLTKATAILLIPVIAVGLIFLKRSGESWANVLKGAALIGIWALLLSGWWFVRNQQLYGELLPLKAFDRAFAGTALAAPRIARLGALGYAQAAGILTFLSFWAVFGNPDAAGKGYQLFLPEQIYWFPLLLVVAAVGGMTRLHFVRRRVFTETQLRAVWLLMVTLGLVALSFVAFLAKYMQTQGRYLYPAMLPICLLLALGWLAVFPAKYRSMAGGCLLGFMALLTALFLSAVQAAG